MARNDPTIYMRIPQDLKDRLDEEAEKNKRSMTAEVVARLQQSFSEPSRPEAAGQSEMHERLKLYRMETGLDMLSSQLSQAMMQRELLGKDPDQDKLAAVGAHIASIQSRISILRKDIADQLRCVDAAYKESLGKS